MKRSSLAFAACGICAGALMTSLGCGSALFRLGDDSPDADGGIQPAHDADASDTGTIPPPQGDSGKLPDGAPIPEACTKLGATRACADATHVQTCLPQDTGDSGWSACVPTACGGASPLPAGTLAACIPAGSFTMGGLGAGAGASEGDTIPAHSIALSRRYFLDQFEVSVGELNTWWNNGNPVKPSVGKLIFVSGSGDVMRWTAADDASVAAPGTGLLCTGNPSVNKPMASINCVNRATALAYCLSVGGRLPTEAEWEYAATGQGKDNSFPWGGNAPTNVEEKSCLLTIDKECTSGPNGAQFPFSRPAATSGNTNATLGGLNNLAGNMAEWTLDFAPAQGAACAGGTCWPAGGSDPWSATDTGEAVVRGGSFHSNADQIRTKSRSFTTTNAPDDPTVVGFRCVHLD